RVSTFPRSGSTESFGSSARSCARRRTDAVPIRMPGASWPAPQRASRGSSRVRKAATASPSTSVDVMSFAEWTATSMRPARRASSISFTKTPRSPISPNGFERSRSPAVVMGTSATSRSGLAKRSASAAISACVSASLLPRLPSRRITVVEIEEVPYRVRVDDAVGGRGRLLHPNGRRVKEFVHDLCGERLDRTPLARAQGAEATFGTFELTRPDRLGASSERCDGRDDVERELPGAETLGLLGDDRFGAHGLLAPARDAFLDHPLEVVDVVEVRALAPFHGGIDVAPDGDVNEEDGPALAGTHRTLHLLGREDVATRAGRGDDDVHLLELGLHRVEARGAAAEAAGEPLRSFDRAVDDEDALD